MRTSTARNWLTYLCFSNSCLTFVLIFETGMFSEYICWISGLCEHIVSLNVLILRFITTHRAQPFSVGFQNSALSFCPIRSYTVWVRTLSGRGESLLTSTRRLRQKCRGHNHGCGWRSITSRFTRNLGSASVSLSCMSSHIELAVSERSSPSQSHELRLAHSYSTIYLQFLSIFQQ